LENDMSNGSEGDAPALERLSALMDGELEPSSVASTCAAWREQGRARSAWHAYHLIGDVLRSDDLAFPPARDAAFLAVLRTRLAAEPVVLAPEVPIASPAARPAGPRAGERTARWSWKAPSAVAAGFVLVAGALVATRSPETPPSVSTTVVQAPAAPAAPVVAAGPTLPPVALPSALAPTEPFVSRRLPPVEGTVIRDARLDRYLAAHQQFAGSSALGMPSGFLRNAAADAPNR
jgi:sigma-E factor negative regulatory protein RseA